VAEAFILLAALILVVHLLFNAWVVCGALVTEGSPTLERLHILSLFYGAVMENVSWPCPLTIAQKWSIAKAGRTPYEGDFMIHYLRAIVSPNFPLGLLRWGAIAVLLVNLWIYARRHMRPRKPAYHL
jgi:hypothetical protein